MSDTPVPPEPSPDAPVAAEHDLEVDLAAFLPEGTTLASADDDGAEGDDADEVDAAEPDGAAPAADAWPAEGGTWPAADVEAAAPLVEGEPAVEDEPPVEVVPAPEAPKDPPVDLAALGQIEADLGAVDAALLALDQGRYGTCAACDAPIDDADLAADPVRTTCPTHTAA